MKRLLLLAAACQPEEDVVDPPLIDEPVAMAHPASLTGEAHAVRAHREQTEGITVKSVYFLCESGLWTIGAWPSERVAEASFIVHHPGGEFAGQLAPTFNFQEEHGQLFLAERPILTSVPEGWRYVATDLPCQPVTPELALLVELRDEVGDLLGCTTLGTRPRHWDNGKCDAIDDAVFSRY